jgi:hypothetical protein
LFPGVQIPERDANHSLHFNYIFIQGEAEDSWGLGELQQEYKYMLAGFLKQMMHTKTSLEEFYYKKRTKQDSVF